MGWTFLLYSPFTWTDMEHTDVWQAEKVHGGCKGSNTSKQTLLTWTASHCGFISWGNRWRRRDWWVLTEIRIFCLLKPLRLIKVMSVWCSVYILMIEVITGNTRTQEFDMNWKNRHVEVFSYSCSFKLCLQLIINMHEDSVYM